MLLYLHSFSICRVTQSLHDLYPTQEAVTNQSGKPAPRGWEHSHNNVIMTYRMYFNGTDPNPTLPPPIPFKEVIVPVAKDANYMVRMPGDTDQTENCAVPPSPGPHLHERMESAEDRMDILQEIRAHMDLLNDFVGIIPQEKLIQRKRDLYNALPNAPPSMSERGKRTRHEVDELSGLQEM